jgi:LytS/YehU family sensor histidine kinase
MKKRILKFRFPLVGALVGGVIGYLYYYFVGCAKGTCMITSSPKNSTIYGVVMGFLLVDLFVNRKKKKDL